jgi:TP901 family phage tail tape measure protein
MKGVTIMADLEKTVSIIFSGVDDASKTINQVAKSLDSFSGGINKATQPLADLSSAVLKTEAALAALAAGGLAYAYAQSIKFEAATIDLKKVIGDEIGMLDEASEAALELSNQYGVASSSVLQSTADFKQAGFSVGEAMQLTKNALDLVIAGDIEASQASEILIASLKGFNAPASEATRLIDILNQVSNEYATDVEQLGIGMAALSPISSQMGFSFEETAGILTPVIEVFRSGDEAATALKTGLLKLVDDSKPVQDALAAIGVSQRDANGQLKSGKEILYEVAAAFVGLNENEKSFITQQLVGINQSARMITVFDNLGKSTEVTATAMGSAGSAASEVVARLASGEVAVDRFKVGFENLAIAIGDRFRDAATGAIGGATDIENTLSDLAKSGAFDEVLDVVERLATSMGDKFHGIAEALPEALAQVDWSKFSASLEALVSEIGDLFDAMFGDIDLTTPEGLAKAIQKVVDAGTALNNVVIGIFNALEPFIQKLSEMIDTFSKGDKDVQDFAGNMLGLGQALNTLSGLGSGVASMLSGVAAVFSTLINLKLASLVTDTGSLSKNLSALGAIGKIALPVTISIIGGQALAELVYTMIPGLKELDQKVFKATLELGGNLYDFLIGDAAAQVGEWGATVGGLIGKEINRIFGKEKTWEELHLPIHGDLTGLEKDLYEYDWSKWTDDPLLIITPQLDFSGIDTSAIEDALKDVPFDITPTMAPIDDEWVNSQDWSALEDFDWNKGLEIPAEILVEMDEKQVEKEADKAKRKITQEFKSATVAPIDVKLNVNGTGVGPAFETGLTEHFKDNPLSMDNIFDPGSIADLFDALEKAKDPSTVAKIERAIDQAIELQLRLAEAQESYIKGQDALLQQQWQLAYQTKMTAEMEKTIKIDAQGLEPEMEAFMWKLLKKIQVRANESGAEFLLAAAS